MKEVQLQEFYRQSFSECHVYSHNLPNNAMFGP
jgi:hypothetical protein